MQENVQNDSIYLKFKGDYKRVEIAWITTAKGNLTCESQYYHSTISVSDIIDHR